MSVVGTRVLKAHTDAVKAALGPAAAAAGTDGLDGFARVMAEAVVTAEDHSKTRYCVAVRTPTNELVVFGPYATFTAAKAAIDTGSLGVAEGSRGGVFPLIPAPKNPRPSTKRKTKE